jgi:multisubunit Na+/H+ antiporter MnhB subunit
MSGPPRGGFVVVWQDRAVILLYPLLLVGAAMVMHRARSAGVGHRGWPWAALWALAGALFMFSLLTGFSIGLFLLPVVTVAVFWLAANAPGGEVAGFAAGALAVLVVVLAFVA